MGIKTTKPTFLKHFRNYCEKINVVASDWKVVKAYLVSEVKCYVRGNDVYGIGLKGKSAFDDLINFDGTMEEE